MDSPPAWSLALAFVVGLELFLRTPMARRNSRLLERALLRCWALLSGLLLWSVVPGGIALPEWGLRILGFGVTLLGADLLWRAFDRFVLSTLRDTQGRATLPQIARDLFGWIFVVLVLFLAGREFFGWELSRLALGSAVGTAIVGFALQDVLKHAFAGLALQLEGSLGLWHWIEMDGEPRQIVGLNWRATRLRNNLDHEFLEPNANLLGARIVHFGNGSRPVAIVLEVPLSLRIPPEQGRASLERAARRCRLVEAQPTPIALVRSFGTHAVHYELRAWTRQVHQLARVRDQLLTHVWYGLARDGLALPFPVQSLELRDAAQEALRRDEREHREVEQLLAAIPLFQDLSRERRAELAAKARWRPFAPGERLVAEGSPGDSLFFLASGEAVVRKGLPDQRLVELARLGPGDWFGEMSLLTGAPRAATVEATSAIECYEIDRSALAPLFETEPRLAERLSQRLTEHLAATQTKLEELPEGEAIAAAAGVSGRILERILRFFQISQRP